MPAMPAPTPPTHACRPPSPQAGYEVVLPQQLSSACCGMAFDSRGYRDVGDAQASALEALLLEASDDGRLPIVCDTSPCLQRMKEKFSSPLLKFAIYEPVQFIALYLQKELDFSRVRDRVAVRKPNTQPSPCALPRHPTPNSVPAPDPNPVPVPGPDPVPVPDPNPVPVPSPRCATASPSTCRAPPRNSSSTTR